MTTPLTYSRPGLEVVVVPLALRPPLPPTRSGPALHVLLRPRTTPPYRDALALPSAFVGHDTRVHVATRQALGSVGLAEEAVSLHDAGLMDAPNRDPRDRILAVARLALVRAHHGPAGDGAEGPREDAPCDPSPTWRPVDPAHPAAPVTLAKTPRPERLAFDHGALIAAALDRLRALAHHTLAPLGLVSEPFTLTAAQRAFELALGRPLDKRNFRRKLGALGVLMPAGERPAGGRTPAKLFRLDRAAWRRAVAHAAPPRP